MKNLEGLLINFHSFGTTKGRAGWNWKKLECEGSGVCGFELLIFFERLSHLLS